jgi:hypothetical protein
MAPGEEELEGERYEEKSQKDIGIQLSSDSLGNRVQALKIKVPIEVLEVVNWHFLTSEDLESLVFQVMRYSEEFSYFVTTAPSITNASTTSGSIIPTIIIIFTFNNYIAS